jgi:uncharacterized protein YjbI with pentapeptide repeats
MNEHETARHPRFHGNWEDLRQFEMLASSAVRSSMREDALRAWGQYRLERQIAAPRPPQPKDVKPLRKTRAYIPFLAPRVVNLTGADLHKIRVGYADLQGVIFDECHFGDAWLKAANLANASLRGADLRGAHLPHASLRSADLTGAKLSGVDLSFASLDDAILTKADLSGANLSHASLVRATVDDAIFRNTMIYGIAAWDLQGVPKEQEDLIITAGVIVENLDFAQFMYLLLNNQKIRNAIDALTTKTVLILGRFTLERKAILDATRKELRERGYWPVLFDFEKPSNRNKTETVSLLAHMARFVIADITDPRSIPQELMAIVRDLPSVPVQPLLLASQQEYGMFEDFRDYQSVLEPFRYENQDHLLASLGDMVISPAEAKVRQRTGR